MLFDKDCLFIQKRKISKIYLPQGKGNFYCFTSDEMGFKKVEFSKSNFKGKAYKVLIDNNFYTFLEDKKVLTNFGYKSLSELTIGDVIMVADLYVFPYGGSNLAMTSKVLNGIELVDYDGECIEADSDTMIANKFFLKS